MSVRRALDDMEEMFSEIGCAVKGDSYDASTHMIEVDMETSTAFVDLPQPDNDISSDFNAAVSECLDDWHFIEVTDDAGTRIVLRGTMKPELFTSEAQERDFREEAPPQAQ